MIRFLASLWDSGVYVAALGGFTLVCGVLLSMENESKWRKKRTQSPPFMSAHMYACVYIYNIHAEKHVYIQRHTYITYVHIFIYVFIYIS